MKQNEPVEYFDGYNKPCGKVYYYIYWGYYTFFMSMGATMLIIDIAHKVIQHAR
jgi:hypothetical protein